VPLYSSVVEVTGGEGVVPDAIKQAVCVPFLDVAAYILAVETAPPVAQPEPSYSSVFVT
jgi:hypothetical protein